MTKAARRVSLGGALISLTVLAFVGWWFVLRTPPGPPEAEGRAWLTRFSDLLTSPRALGARGPGALALFPGLGPWSTGRCVTEWSRSDASAPIVTYQRLELGRLDGDACVQAQFGMLSTTLRQSEGVTPGALMERFTAAFGPPDFHQDWTLGGSATTTWQVLDGIHITLEEPVGPGGGAAFSLLFVRQYGTATAIPTAAEGEQWMSRIVDLMTGPALLAARGPAAVKLIDADMQPQLFDDSGCPTEFIADPKKAGAIGSDQDVALRRAPGEPCGDAVVSSVSMQIWRREPVTAEALVKRIAEKIGAPTVSRTFERSGVDYEWHTPAGTTVELYEGLSGGFEHWLRLRMNRS